MTADNPDLNADDDVLAVASQLQAKKQPFALATVIETEGSTSARTSAKAIFDAEGGVVLGWVGGGCAQSTVAHAALESLRTNASQIVELDLNDEVLGTGMPCGGSMKVYIEPVLPRPTLWILGHGRVAECLCRIGALMDFDVVVDDPLAEQTRFPAASRVVADDPNYDIVKPGTSDFIILATQSSGDHQSMKRILASGKGSISLIASHKRAKLVLDYLRGDGLDKEALDRVRTPAGLDLGAQTPEEIALSVISEIVLFRRRGHGFVICRAEGQNDGQDAASATNDGKGA
jgi:xanthine dehydrogenase accessory factor